MKLKRKDIIVKCRADTFMPLAAMFGICVIMHGDSSPGGGFQGGVLAAGAFLLFFLGYGGRKNYFNYQKGYIPRLEAVAEIVYIAVAVVGICAGGNFCLNIILSHHCAVHEQRSRLQRVHGHLLPADAHAGPAGQRGRK